MKRFAVTCLLLSAIFFASCVNNTAFAYDSLKMLNSTGKTIYYVYLSPSHEGWGPDRLNGVWHNGNTLTLKVPKWQYWDLKIVFKDGQEAFWTNKAIDTTAVYNLTISRNNSGGYTLHFNS